MVESYGDMIIIHTLINLIVYFKGYLGGPGFSHGDKHTDAPRVVLIVVQVLLWLGVLACLIVSAQGIASQSASSSPYVEVCCVCVRVRMLVL